MEKKKGKVHEIIKTISIILLIYVLFVCYLYVCSARFEKIENGEITLISQNNE